MARLHEHVTRRAGLSGPQTRLDKARAGPQFFSFTATTSNYLHLLHQRFICPSIRSTNAHLGHTYYSKMPIIHLHGSYTPIFTAMLARFARPPPTPSTSSSLSPSPTRRTGDLQLSPSLGSDGDFLAEQELLGRRTPPGLRLAVVSDTRFALGAYSLILHQADLVRQVEEDQRNHAQWATFNQPCSLSNTERWFAAYRAQEANDPIRRFGSSRLWEGPFDRHDAGYLSEAFNTETMQVRTSSCNLGTATY